MDYHTNTYGSSEAGFKTGLLKSIHEASTNGTNQVLLLARSLKYLKGGVFASVLGQVAVKNLARTKSMRWMAITIYLETERTRSAFSKGVIFAPFVSHRLLAVAAGDSRGTDVVYVPWTEAELQTYVQNNPSSVKLCEPS